MGSKNSKIELSDEDLNMLAANTSFTKDQILRWYSAFREECKEGCLDKKAFSKFYSDLLPNNGNATEFANLVFTAFDKDESGTIDFTEFLLAFTITGKGSLRDRLNWAFDYYDQDKSNYIDAKELRKVLKAIYKMMNVNTSEENSAENKANKIFQDLDLNDDRKLSREEFVNGLLNDEFLQNLLGPF